MELVWTGSASSIAEASEARVVATAGDTARARNIYGLSPRRRGDCSPDRLKRHLLDPRSGHREANSESGDAL